MKKNKKNKTSMFDYLVFLLFIAKFLSEPNSLIPCCKIVHNFEEYQRLIGLLFEYCHDVLIF